MKFPSIKNLIQGTTQTIKRFPFETLFALCGAIGGTLWVRNHDFGSVYKDNCVRVMMTANLGLLMSLAFSLYSESKKITGYKMLLIKIIAAALSVSFFWMLNPFDREYDILRFFLMSFALHLIVAYAAFTEKGRVQGFWQFNKTIFLRFLAGALYSGVLYLGLLAAILSTKYLFNIHWNDDTYFILWVWIASIFNSLFFLAGVPSDFDQLDEDVAYPKGLKIFTQYVLIPLATVYVVILLAYEVKILIEWRLPKGYVSNLILGYSVFGILSILLVYPVREQAENKWLKIYARSFYFLLIPLIILLFLAMFARVLPYGITPQRYLLIVLAIWLSFVTFYFLFSKKQNIKIIPVSLSLLTLLSIYGPQGAFSVSNYSQKRILINIFKKYDAYKNGKLESVEGKKITENDGKNALAKLDFLINNGEWNALQPYVSKDLKAVNDSLMKKQSGSGDNLRYLRYNIHFSKLNWFKRYLGLRKFSEYGGYDNDNNGISYHFSTNEDRVLNVKSYDYAISLLNGYGSYNSDTIVFRANNLRFVMKNSTGNHSLSINGELVSFDTKALADSLIKPAGKLKLYKEASQHNPEYGYKSFEISDSLMTVTKQTKHYTITLKLNDIRFNEGQNDSNAFLEVSGNYLVKVR